MWQWHKHLSTAPHMFPDIGFYRRIAALKLVLVSQPFKNALGGMALFRGTVEIILQPLVNEAGEAIKFGAFYLHSSPIAGRDRKKSSPSSRSHAITRNGPLPPVRSCRPDAGARSSCNVAR
jgi:hypothetical protein